jgi:hypothetical protein
MSRNDDDDENGSRSKPHKEEEDSNTISRLEHIEAQVTRLKRASRRVLVAATFALGLVGGGWISTMVNPPLPPHSHTEQHEANPISSKMAEQREIALRAEAEEALDGLKRLNEVADSEAQEQILRRIEEVVESVVEAEAGGELEPNSAIKEYIVTAMTFAAGAVADEVIRLRLKRLLEELERKPRKSRRTAAPEFDVHQHYGGMLA